MDENDLHPDPMVALAAWLEEARDVVPLWNAMALATATAGGRPSVRMVLLRGADAQGLSFFTSRTSRKGDELRENPRAALVLHWPELGRQVRVEGAVESTTDDETEAYWRTRPRASQLAAWASPQSQPTTRAALDAEVVRAEERFAHAEVPLPPFWGGYRVVPELIELWVHRENRLHDRIRYARSGDGWRRERLSP